jgi:Tfp pilus assembly protein PilF
MSDPSPSAGKVRIGLIVAVAVALLAVVMVLRRTGEAPGRFEQLKHFDGVIVPGEGSSDSIEYELYVRASKALEAGDATAAEAIYREIVAKYPDQADSHEALGACLYFQKRHELATESYRQALALSPRSAAALYGLGCVAYSQKRHDEARDFLTKALAIDPDDANSHRVLAFVCEQQGDTAGAKTHLERAIELDASLAAELRSRLDE